MENDWLQIPEECPWRRLDSQVSARIADELKKEIAVGHPLFERLSQLKVVAACDANDDVLVTSSNDANMLFCVHLTWSGKPENPAGSSPSFVPIAVGALEEFFLS
jgi:hypothetical protein